MPVLPRLISLYRRHGYEAVTGLFPPHFDGFLEVAFTWLLRDGKPTTRNLGIAQQELYFLECLLVSRRVERVFVIGNSFGWSTLALALLCPQARVVALDACLTPDTNAGLVLTNLIAGEEGLAASAVRGISPQDVPAAVRDRLGGRIDLALIDGHHTNEAVWQDFAALKPFLTPDSLLLFHDVQTFRLFDGLKRVVQESGLTAQLMLGTPSGIAAVFEGQRLSAETRAVLDAFSPSIESLRALVAEQERRRQPAAG